MFLRPILENLQIISPEPILAEVNTVGFGVDINKFNQVIFQIQQDKVFAENRQLEDIVIMPLGTIFDLPATIQTNQEFGELFESIMRPVTLSSVIGGSYYLYNPSVEVGIATIAFGLGGLVIAALGTPVYLAARGRIKDIFEEKGIQDKEDNILIMKGAQLNFKIFVITTMGFVNSDVLNHIGRIFFQVTKESLSEMHS